MQFLNWEIFRKQVQPLWAAMQSFQMYLMPRSRLVVISAGVVSSSLSCFAAVSVGRTHWDYNLMYPTCCFSLCKYRAFTSSWIWRKRNKYLLQNRCYIFYFVHDDGVISVINHQYCRDIDLWYLNSLTCLFFYLESGSLFSDPEWQKDAIYNLKSVQPTTLKKCWLEPSLRRSMFSVCCWNRYRVNYILY